MEENGLARGVAEVLHFVSRIEMEVVEDLWWLQR